MALTPSTKQATDKAKSFADRLKTVHTKLNDTMEQGVTSLEQIEASTEAVNAKIAGVVAQKTADLGALNDVLNQLTNGAPDDEAETTTEPAPPTT